MFERFTDLARRVVVRAQEEARLLDHSYIGTEHLLLGLVREGEGVGAKALESLGVSLQAARTQVEQIIGRGGSTPTGHIPFTPRAKRVIELALREAMALGHNYIGTEHLLLGLVSEGEGVAAQVLDNLGADLSRVRAKVIGLLSGYPGASGAVSGGTGRPAGEAVARTVFVVHGRADERLDEVERLIESLTGRPPVVLHRQPDDGRAIIAAFEEHAQPAVAVVILSGDDEGRTRAGDSRLHLRAPQQVVYEMGWFHGRLGRNAVVALIEEGVEAPSDIISGVVPIPLDAEAAWRHRLGQELRAAGVEVDLDNID